MSKHNWHRPAHIDSRSEARVLQISTIAASDLFLQLKNVRPFVMPIDALFSTLYDMEEMDCLHIANGGNTEP